MKLVLSLVLAAAALGACEKKDPVRGAEPAPPSTPLVAAASAKPADATPTKVSIPNVVVAETGTTKVHVSWKLPAGTGVNDGAPFRVRWTSSEGLAHAPEDMHSKGADVTQGFDVQVTPANGAPSQLAGDVNVVVCDVATHRVCVPVTRRIEMTFLAEGKSPTADVTVPLPEARPQG